MKLFHTLSANEVSQLKTAAAARDWNAVGHIFGLPPGTILGIVKAALPIIIQILQGISATGLAAHADAKTTVIGIIQQFGPVLESVLSAVIQGLPAGSTLAEILTALEQFLAALIGTPAPAA